jgi:hypothetical protein
MFYKSEFFKPYELVDKPTYDRWPENIWFLFRQDALISLDSIKAHFGKTIIVNSWYWGGAFSQRGLRMPTCLDYSPYSQHSLGNAFDLDVKGISANEVRAEILANKDSPEFELITCLEININWVHFDCRNYEPRILLVQK